MKTFILFRCAILYISITGTGVASCNDQATTTSVTATDHTVKQELAPAVTIGRLLPTHVRAYVQTHVAEYTIVDTADYGISWWSFYDRSVIPFAVTTDINDDRFLDYALLVKKNQVLRLVIVLGTAHGFTHHFIHDFNEAYKQNNLQYGLMVEPPGQTDVVVPEERSLILPSNGIALMELENKARIYYWQDGGIKTFYMK